MNLQEIMNQISTLGGQIRQANAKLAQDATNSSVPTSELEKQQAVIADMNKRMAALQASYNAMKDSQVPGLTPVPSQPEQSRDLRDMLRSNEYARAFAYAIQNGIGRKNGQGNEKVKILFDALTEGGGNPVGTDGGFLVPEDIDHTILEVKRSLDPLSALFNEETVTAPTGWRVMDTAPDTGLVDVDEMGQIDDDDDQPAFAKVPYSCSKKALILPVSNELASDNVANLFAYLGRWFAKKLVITENIMLITALRTLTAVSIATDPLKGIKQALNKGLDPAISAGANVIMNVDAFDVLDQLMDGNERPLLQPDPVNATIMRIKGRPIHSVSRRTLANVTTGSGASAVTTSDLFIGDGKEFATLFRCGAFELSSTDIGGNAWRTDSTELRGITRLGVSKFDAEAMVRRQLTIEA
jgi:HK97 family phage major capsid protein